MLFIVCYIAGNMSDLGACLSTYQSQKLVMAPGEHAKMLGKQNRSLI